MSQQQPTIIIVDDDDAIMRCVAAVLWYEENITVLGRTTHAQAAVAMATQTHPDVVLMDIHMPGADPFLACAEIINSTQPRCHVLFYTAFPKDQYLDRCLASGASGMVSKHSESIRNLGLAIHHVLRGEKYFSPELAQRLVQLKEGAPKSRISTLSHRQLEVLREIAHGKTQPEIARTIGMSERTVHNEIGTIKKKLDLHTANELLLFAIHEGLVFPELQAK